MTGQIAARAGDPHLCSATTFLIPHVAGPLLPPGSKTVLVPGGRAATYAELATCAMLGVTIPDVVTGGAATVWFDGLPAARHGDALAHGGTIAAGTPRVIIGGPPQVSRPVRWVVRHGELQVQFGSSIFIRPNPTNPLYQGQAVAAYLRLSLTPAVQSALADLEASGRTITVEPYHNPRDPTNATTGPDSFADALPAGATITFPKSTRTITGTGRGTNSTIAWNPETHGSGASASDEENPGSDIILGHETVHATRNATARFGSGPVNGNDVFVNEERGTTGLPAQTYDYPGKPSDPLNGTRLPATDGAPYSDNAIRDGYRARGIRSPATGAPPAPRTSYYAPGAGPF
jgi:uncharacterized Zn-binding protein involved in type VI secretion